MCLSIVTLAGLSNLDADMGLTCISEFVAGIGEVSFAAELSTVRRSVSIHLRA
jgi:hypothetical protein